MDFDLLTLDYYTAALYMYTNVSRIQIPSPFEMV